MSARLARNLIAALAVVLILSLILISEGCTTYDIKACPMGGEVCTEVHTTSWRQFEKPVIVYERTEADGSGVTFNFGAENVTGSYIEQAAGQTLMQLPGVIGSFATPVVVAPDGN